MQIVGRIFLQTYAETFSSEIENPFWAEIPDVRELNAYVYRYARKRVRG